MHDGDLLADDYPVLVLVDDEDIEHRVELLAELQIEDNFYRVRIPPHEAEEEECEVIILKVVYDEEGAEFLSDIEDEEEWEMVADAWQELVDNEGL